MFPPYQVRKFYPRIWTWAFTTEKVRPKWAEEILDHLKIVVQATNSLKTSDQNLILR